MKTRKISAGVGRSITKPVRNRDVYQRRKENPSQKTFKELSIYKRKGIPCT